jgi:hypothetical protein
MSNCAKLPQGVAPPGKVRSGIFPGFHLVKIEIDQVKKSFIDISIA